VDAPQAVAIALEVERERRKGARRAEPHVAVGAPVDHRLELVSELPAHDAVETVGRDHEVGSQEGTDVPDLRADLEAHPHRFGAAAQDREQRPPRQAAEAMAGRGDDGAVEVDVDVVPMMESPRHLFVSLAIRVGQVVLGGVGEDDAEPERGIEGIPLDHRDVVGGIGLLHLDREVEPGRPATQHDDLHGALSPAARFRSCPATIKCWISVVPS